MVPDSGLSVVPGPCRITATAESKNQIPVCSKDGLLQGDDIVGYFPGTASSWEPKPAPKDVEGMHISYRYLDITARAHDPGVVLVEGKILFDKPMTITGAHLFAIFSATQQGEGDHYAISTPEYDSDRDGCRRALQRKQQGSARQLCHAVSLTWGSGGVMVLDDGYLLEVYAKTGNGMWDCQWTTCRAK